MEEPDFGKGVAQLLSLTREKGSLSAAYKSMGMAASKAWKILNRAEEVAEAVKRSFIKNFGNSGES